MTNEQKWNRFWQFVALDIENIYKKGHPFQWKENQIEDFLIDFSEELYSKLSDNPTLAKKCGLYPVRGRFGAIIVASTFRRIFLYQSSKGNPSNRNAFAAYVGLESAEDYLAKKVKEEPLIYVDQVCNKDEHADMWRWNQRLFRFRHSKIYQNFDLIGLELGRSWWERYPLQDMVLRDWKHEQIGQLCLCPISKKVFDALSSGEYKESDLKASDILTPEQTNLHSYWYLANWMKTRILAGRNRSMGDLAAATLRVHILDRCLNDSHFASCIKEGSISIIAFVETPSLKKQAESNRFFKVYPNSEDSVLRQIHISVRSRKQLEVQYELGTALIQRLLPIYQDCAHQRIEVFQQPPNY